MVRCEGGDDNSGVELRAARSPQTLAAGVRGFVRGRRGGSLALAGCASLTRPTVAVAVAFEPQGQASGLGESVRGQPGKIQARSRLRTAMLLMGMPPFYMEVT